MLYYIASMTNRKESGRKWDGRSRIPTDHYRKRWDEIFKKRVMDGKDPFVKEQEELKESYEQSKRAKKERDDLAKIWEKKPEKEKLEDTKKLLEEIADRNGF